MDNHVAKFAEYFKITIDAYKQSLKDKYDITSSDPWVLFVIEEKERNVTDQKITEAELQFTYGIKSLRCTFKEIYENMEFDKNNHILKINGKEIGFVYYRSGY